MKNKFGLDLFGKKRIALLEKELSDLEKETGWVANGKIEYQGLPEIRISDSEFVDALKDNFVLSRDAAKGILDFIEKLIPEKIAGGKRALSWQGLGTFYSVERQGRWRPRVRFHKAFKRILNK